MAIVGLNRELSREALIRYQHRELAGVAADAALPVKAEEAPMRAGQHVEVVLREGEEND